MPEVAVTHGESRLHGASPYAVLRTNRRPYPRPDGVTALTVYLVALCAVPARLVVGPLAGLGAPSTLGALLLAGWWIWYQVSRTEPGTCSQPVRLGYFACLGAFLASYAVAMLRPIDSTEFSTAQIGMIGLVGWGGILLVANDGVPTLDRLITLCRRISFAGGALATLGVLQFATGQQIVDRVKIPGLVANGALVALGSREGFNRPSATALHPIEFGAVITMILPIAIALALTDTGRSTLRRWTPVAAIALAIPLSISRSALLSSVVALLVLGVAWTPAVRAKAAVAVAGLTGVVFVLAPGVLASLSRLFLSIGGSDTSAQSRTDSYGMAAEYIGHSPLLGRGFATFLPSYRILDNQLLGLLIEVGAVGLLAFLGMIAVAVWCGVRTRKRSTDPVAAQLGQACAAGLCAGVVSLALFDGLAFPMSGCMLFLLTGVAGAGWRIARRPAETPRCSSSARPATRPAPGLDGLWRGRDDVVVIAAANGWGERRMADRQLAEALARHAPVLYVDPAASVVSRLRSDGLAATRRRTPVTVVHEHLVRLSPDGLPGLSRPGVARLNRSVVARQIRATLARAGGRVHAHVEANMLSPTMALVPAATRVFWAQDDFVGMAPLVSVSPALLAASVHELAATADLVVAANPAVAASLPDSACVRLIPFGCDVDLFATGRSVRAGRRARPTAVLMGTLNDRLDVSLLRAVVDAGVDLLMLGPRSPRWPSAAFDDLLRHPAVRWPGAVDFEDLPCHLVEADVGLVPYTHSRFNEGSFPLKTLEYLAAGLPVVATDLPAIRWLSSPHVQVADDPAAFAAAVRDLAGRPSDPALAEARSTEAAGHSWARRAEAFADALGLGPAVA